MFGSLFSVIKGAEMPLFLTNRRSAMAETKEIKVYFSSPMETALMTFFPLRGKGKNTVHETIQFIKIDKNHGEYATDNPKIQEWLEKKENGYGHSHVLAGKKFPKFNKAKYFSDEIMTLSPLVQKKMEDEYKGKLDIRFAEELGAKLKDVEDIQIQNAIRYGELKGKEKLSEEEKAELKKLEEAFK